MSTASAVVPVGYKQTEVGVIPEDWIFSTWGDLIERCIGGSTPSRAIPGFFKGNIPWITSTELNYNHINDTIEKITSDAVTSANLTMLPIGTFLMAITGLEAEGTRGSCAITNIRATTNQSCMAIIPKSTLDTIYLYYFYLLNGDDFALKYCQGSKQQSYTSALIKTLPIIFPSDVNEQKNIAKTLFEASELVDSLEELITKKRGIKQGTMQELLTGKIRLPGFTENWVVKQVSNFGTIVTGSTPLTHKPEFWGGNIPWITPTDITNKNEISTSERLLTIEGLDSIRILPENSVLVTCIASIGKNVILRTRGSCNQQINAIIPNEKHSTEFLYFLFENNKNFMLGNAGITATMIISKTGFERFKFLIPNSLVEQEAIAEVLSDMDAEIAALEERLEKAKAIKQSMMQQLLTGKIRLVEPQTSQEVSA